jgi:hypothetical protein
VDYQPSTNQQMPATHTSGSHAAPDSEPRPWRWVILIVGLVLILVVLYAEENFRGKRAWEQYRREISKRGELIDWQSFIPAPVPDDQNVLADAKMSAWFVGRGGNDLSRRLSSGRDSFLLQRASNYVAELTIIPPGTLFEETNADLVLRYEDSVLLLDSEPLPWPHQEVIPLVVIDEVPILALITNLANQAQLKFTFDPSLDLSGMASLPPFSVRWENVTAISALQAFLERYALTLKIGSNRNRVRISAKDPYDPEACVSERATVELTKALLASMTSATNQPTANAVQAFTTFVKSVGPVTPVRIAVLAQGSLKGPQVERWFSKRISGYFQVAGEARATAAGTNVFKIRISPPQKTAAADYLAWSDQFQADFDHMRAALKRPLVWMPGNYRDPVNIPIPNFICLRMLVQTLAQRAQCELVLGRADEALQELTLMHDICRLLQPPPGGRPETLVAAMIDVAVSSLYVGVAADGLRLEAWREPQLAELQRQLADIHLLPVLIAGLETERASLCHTLQTSTPGQITQLRNGGAATTVWDKLKDPRYAVMNLSPDGWRYQQMRTVAREEQQAIESIDATHGLVHPLLLGATPRSGGGIPAFLFIIDLMPNASRSVQTTARTQTLINEALIMCALERCRLADGHYPASLAAVVPRMIEQAPPDLFGGESLKFSLGPDGKILLYSIGWNATDDGGTPGMKETGHFDLDNGDWVWPFRSSFFR